MITTTINMKENNSCTSSIPVNISDNLNKETLITVNSNCLTNREVNMPKEIKVIKF